MRTEIAATEATPAAVGLKHEARYVVNPKALKRWAEERLTLTERADGSIDALFRYEGTTCSNMGRAIHFDYQSWCWGLGMRGIRSGSCNVSRRRELRGIRYMCQYMANAEHLMVAIDHEKPLLGQPLNDVLTWERPAIGAGCYCEPASRKHKWGLVLETIILRWCSGTRARELSSRQ